MCHAALAEDGVVARAAAKWSPDWLPRIVRCAGPPYAVKPTERTPFARADGRR